MKKKIKIWIESILMMFFLHFALKDYYLETETFNWWQWGIIAVGAIIIDLVLSVWVDEENGEKEEKNYAR